MVRSRGIRLNESHATTSSTRTPPFPSPTYQNDPMTHTRDRRSYPSILSIGSTGSILSIGSAGSILSIGSVGSVASIGSAGSAFSILSWLSFGSVMSAVSVFGVLSWLVVRRVRASGTPTHTPASRRR